MSDMNEQQILEYNKRCAKFMGYQVMTEESFLMYEYPKGTDLSKVYIDTALVFHSDWNWIMEVVEAIEKLGGTIIIEHTTCNIQPKGGPFKTHPIVGETKKEAVVKAINQLLIWYNGKLN